ncbi:MAG: site-2 protease family protein [Candidatus Pacebacteria bacterium]|nr:site-2 protease family protein [Candidatus Paceibacterota bacterium]
MVILFVIIILLFSVIIHEVAHGAMAYHLGDPTAKYAGRLSLNPVKHLDPIGSILVPLLLILLPTKIVFGWAKPVPINPYNFKDQKYGQAKVAFAGAGTNLLIALIFGLCLRFFSSFFVSYPSLLFIFAIITFINLILAIFNLLPIPPLDGSHILFTFVSEKTKMFLQQYGIFILLFFMFFLLGELFVLIRFIFELIVGFSPNLIF